MFADNLKSLLKSRNITQKELAEFIGVKPNTVSDWLKQGNSPKIEHLCRISEYFQISLDWLLKGEKPLNEKKHNSQDTDDIGKSLEEDEKLLVQNYRDLNEKEKDEIQGRTARLAVKAGNKKLLTSPNTEDDSGDDLEMIG